MLSEEFLIKGCIAGDRTAQRQLYEQYNRVFFALCLRYMPNREEAEDVMIMGFMAIFEKMNTFKEDGSFEGWMRRVMVNTAISALRTNNIRSFAEVGEEMLDDVGMAMSQNVTYSAISVRDIMNQIRQLPSGFRAAFNLCVIEGYSYEETADILQINVGTIRSQVSRARKLLRGRLKGYR
ncbi:MAG: RNA polymerase sigma factor [Lentimicrobiaceae bacterium]|nr:RNA polymerase sigma factor [Lentimicrobiaceae bacterium]